jgi:hypothetical protein
MDAAPPNRYHMAAKPRQAQKEKPISDSTMTIKFQGGKLVLEGAEWQGPMKALSPGWTDTRQYASKGSSVRIAYRYSADDIETFKRIIERKQATREETDRILEIPNASENEARVEKLDKRLVLVVRTKSSKKNTRSIITANGENSALVLISITEADGLESPLAARIIDSIKFEKTN